ncbi:MAG: hypothetical protein U5L45_04370 [Saprospiraceae bacterium]|nr:hypothetical protein [Saprospiraceae bacterium]
MKENILQQIAQVNSESHLLRLKELLISFAQEMASKEENRVQKDKRLIAQINKTALPIAQLERCNNLLMKMKFATLTDTEHQELLTITTHEETLRVQRVKHLIELAQLRQISLLQLMSDLELTPQATKR